MGEKHGPHWGTALVFDVTFDDLVSVGLGLTTGGQILEDGPGAGDGPTLGVITHLAFSAGRDDGDDGRRSGAS